MRDLSEITRAGVDDGEGDEANEAPTPSWSNSCASACSSCSRSSSRCAARAASADAAMRSACTDATSRRAHGSQRRVRAPPPPADAAHGPRRDRHRARGAGAAPQQRRRVRLSPGQRFSLPDRLRRARGGGGADSGAASRPSTCCSCAIAIRRARSGTAGAPDPNGAARDYGADDAFPITDIDEILPGTASRAARGCTTPWAPTRSSISAWSAG